MRRWVEHDNFYNLGLYVRLSFLYKILDVPFYIKYQICRIDAYTNRTTNFHKWALSFDSFI